ncbi:MAG: hypothetical protein WCI23_12740 [Chlorobiaceae bacterium]|jgi:hypothetical protein
MHIFSVQHKPAHWLITCSRINSTRPTVSVGPTLNTIERKYFYTNAGCLLLEGSQWVRDVLNAFVLEPAGYTVEDAVAVAGCVVVLYVGLDGFVELWEKVSRSFNPSV